MTIKQKLLYLFFISTSILSQNAFGQTQDAELWSSVSLEKGLIKNMSVSLEVQTRLHENMSLVDKHFIDAGIEYELINNLKAGLGYRFAMTNEIAGYLPEQRYNVDLSYKESIKRLSLGIRSRVQYGDIDFVNDNDAWEQDLTNRYKIDLSYDVYKSSIEPYIASEVYFNMNGKDPWVSEKMRYAAGISFNVGNTGELEFFYLFEQERNVKSPNTSHVYGIGYKFDI